MVAMLTVASGRGSRLKMIIISIHNTSLCGGEYRPLPIGLPAYSKPDYKSR